MRTFTVYYFAALLAAGVFISNGRTDEAEADPFGDASSFPEFSTEPIRSDEAVEVPDGASELQQLREEYVRAAEQRSELMHETTLREAVDTEDKGCCGTQGAEGTGGNRTATAANPGIVSQHQSCGPPTTPARHRCSSARKKARPSIR